MTTDSTKLSNNSIQKNLLIVLITIFLDVFGFSLIIPVLPLLLLDQNSAFYIFDASFDHSQAYLFYGILGGIFPLVSFFAAPILGQLSDKFGRKQVIEISLVGTFFSYLALAFGIMTRNLGLIFVSRVTGGVASGNISVAHTIITDISNSKTKTRNFGWAAAVYGIGIVLGSYCGGQLSNSQLVSWFSATTPFWFASIVALFNLVLAILLLSESNAHINPSLIISKFKAIFSVLYAIRIPSSFRKILIVSFLYMAGFSFVTTFVGPYFIDKFNWNGVDNGNFFGFAGLFIAITQIFLVGIIATKISAKNILKASLFGTAITVFLILFPENNFQLYLLVPFFAFFSSLAITNISSEVSDSTTAAKQGELMGINSGLQNLAQAIPPIFSGLVSYFLDKYGAGTISQNTILTLPLLFASITMFLAGFVYIYNKKV
jgi:MFS transporter, DHA1 family, tetracycline resistance protein